MPRRKWICYDCGSTIAGHHTKLCDLCPPSSKRDLPAIKDTQWWNGRKPRTAKKCGAL